MTTKDLSIPQSGYPIPPGLANEEPELRTELDIPRDAPQAGSKKPEREREARDERPAH